MSAGQQHAEREASIAIDPFRIAISHTDLDDLAARLALTRWPDEPADTGWERGVPLAYLRELTSYWHSGYDWRAQEQHLNRLPQFITKIDRQTIHFVHLRSPNHEALPIVLLHGWPGSFVEFDRLADMLADEFDIIIPSIPGFGFSVPVHEAGWTTGRAGRAFATLMRRLGYQRYGVHGSDVGAGVAGALATAAPDNVVGLHFASDPPSAVSFAMFGGDPAALPGLTDDERSYVERLKQSSIEGGAYLKLQSTRPQTLAYALTDSPAAQLAWIVEKFKEWTDADFELPEHALDIDQLLTNVSVYWFTRSGASAAHFLYDSMRAQEWGDNAGTPTGFAIFGAHPIARRLMDPEGRMAHWSEFTRGGHFPAMEVPELLAADLRAFFRRLR